jgi:hypothetical protein
MKLIIIRHSALIMMHAECTNHQCHLVQLCVHDPQIHILALVIWVHFQHGNISHMNSGGNPIQHLLLVRIHVYHSMVIISRDPQVRVFSPSLLSSQMQCLTENMLYL